MTACHQYYQISAFAWVCGACVCLPLSLSQTNTHTHTHTQHPREREVCAPHLWKMMLGGQSQQTDVSGLLKRMANSPQAWREAMNTFITLMH